MPLILFTQANGGQYDAEAKVGKTLLQTAEANGIDGFFAECGGSCDPAQLALLPAPEKDESEMLDFVADERRPNSRLACQIKITDALDGLRVAIPARQI